MKPIPKLQIYKEGIKLKQNATIFSNRVLNTCRVVEYNIWKNECMVSFQRTGTHDIFVFNAMEALLMISDLEVTTMACSD